MPQDHLNPPHSSSESILTESCERFRVYVEQGLDAIFVHDSSGQFVDVNQQACLSLGYSRNELLRLNVADVDSDFDLAGAQLIWSKIEPNQVHTLRSHHRRKDGSFFPVEHWFRCIDLKEQRLYLVSVRDISELIQTEEILKQERDLNRIYFDTTHTIMFALNIEGCITMINAAGCKLLGYEEKELLGRNWFTTCLPPAISESDVLPVFRRIMAGEVKSVEYFENHVLCRDGRERMIAWHNAMLTDGHGGIIGLLTSGEDITEHKNHEEQLLHIAYYDSLTNLPNRVLLADRLHQGMTQAQRRNKLLAVAYIDLDGFKEVNDRHGHDIGDQLLVTLATRMKQALREGDTLARLGGDEFVAVLFDLEDTAASIPLITRLLEAAAEKIQVGKQTLHVSASIGVTIYPQTENMDADQLLRQADQAMYQAKLAGKNCYHVFDTVQDSSIRGHNESLEHIRRALISREFVLYYQPKVNMRTGKVTGAEALIRWQHPEKGLLPPAVFLPVIDDHPLAVQIGEWVIDTALTQMEIWHAEGLDIPVSVNIGARQLQQPSFVAYLQAALAKHPKIKPSCLELEILETSALEDIVLASHVIETCREIGVMFALDDFGTGYSSLTYLKRLPVRTLKIDQTFVRDMLDDPDDMAILDGVLGLANAFHREVIAEGVETLEHGAMLLQLGCEFAQGHGIARPMPAHEMHSWATNWRPDQSWSNQPAVSRDDLPLLFAGVEHRAWILAIENFLRDESNAPPMLDHLHCRLGEWLNGIGLIRHGSQPGYLIVQKLHQQVHSLASELIELRNNGFDKDELNTLNELHELRGELLAQLKKLTL